MKKLSIYFILCLIVFSCSKKEDSVTPDDNSKQDAVLNYIKSLGFAEKNIQEKDTCYVVEGDIVFPKNMNVSAISKSGRTEQYYGGPTRLIAFANQTNVRIRIDPSMVASPNMTTEINDAISLWNTLNYYGSRIRLTIVTTAPQDILIFNANLGSGTCGDALIPINGLAGTTVRINKALIAGNSYEQRRRTITHEIGHAIGLLHTNAGPGENGISIDVPGVPGTDASSLMNAFQCGIGATTLSTKDRLAISALYPTDMPYGFGNNGGNYPQMFYWNPPLYTGNGSLVNYDVYYTRYDWYGNANTSSTITTTSTNFTLPFTKGQYTGQSVVIYVRARFSNGALSAWGSYNTTL